MLKRLLLVLFKTLEERQCKFLFGLIFLFVLIFIVQCIKHTRYEQVSAAPILYKENKLIIPEHSLLRTTIAVGVAHPQSVLTHIILPATAQAIPSKMVAIFPPIPGQITKIYKKIGESVELGEPLYTLLSSELVRLVEDFNRASANYTLTEKNLNRQHELEHYEIGAMRELEQAENETTQAKAKLQLATLRLTALHINENDRDVTGQIIIRSPIKGVITAVNSGVGSYWTDLTTPIVTVADLSSIYVMASAQESDLQEIFTGQIAQIIFESEHKSILSKIVMIDPILNPETRTTQVGVILDNEHCALKPNMFAKMKLERKEKHLILLPLTAVVQRGFDSIVFVEVAPWEFQARIVKIGEQIGHKIVIQSGLQNNERVAMTGGIFLND